MNEPELRQALSTLADEVRPVALDHGVRRARRRIRARRAATAGIVVLAAIAATGAYAAVHRSRAAVAPGGTEPTLAPPCVTYQPPVVLPVPPGGQLGDDAVTDPTGRYVVSGDVLWTDGTPSLLPRVLSNVAVNAGGDVIGNLPSGAFAYHAGTLTALPSVPGYTMTATAINASGDITGFGNGGTGGHIGVVWPAGHRGDIRRLRTVVGQDVAPAAIAGDGTVVATVSDGSGGSARVVVWRGTGPGQPLDEPAGALGTTLADEFAMDGWGGMSGPWVIGVVELGPTGPARLDPTRLIRWNLGTGAFTVYPSGYGRLADVDSYGDVLADALPSSDGPGGPTVIRSAGPYRLQVPAGYQPQGNAASSMSADGHVIVGVDIDIAHNGALLPLEWRC